MQKLHYIMKELSIINMLNLWGNKIFNFKYLQYLKVKILSQWKKFECGSFKKKYRLHVVKLISINQNNTGLIIHLTSPFMIE